jgi:hypothetical protein
MRRNDAPGEHGALADARAAGSDAPRRRPDEEHLRQRLAGLRASHPSSPEYRGGEAAPENREVAGDHEVAEEPEVAGGHEVAEEPEVEGERDGEDRSRGPAEGKTGGLPGPEGGPPPDESGDARPGHARPGHGEPGRPVPPGSSEPYRPWFSSGEPLEPWFTADPGDPPG